MRRKQLRKKEPQVYDADCCGTCKHYSSEGYRITGYCMKSRKPVKWKNCCGFYKPDIKVEYNRECKTARSSW